VDLFLYVVLILVEIASFLIIAFRTHRKRQSVRLQQKLNEKREEIVDAVTSFRSILNSEHYITKAGYSDWYVSWNHLRPIILEIDKKYLKTLHASPLWVRFLVEDADF
jgi:hypothetical protein